VTSAADPAIGHRHAGPLERPRGLRRNPLEVIVFTGLLLLVGYAWMRRNERGLEQGKALTEMSGRALQASGYQLTSWGEEDRKGKTASPYPQKYEKEYTLDGIPFRSYIELQSPQKNRAVITASIYSGIVCYYRHFKSGESGGRISKLNELDIQTLAVRALRNFMANKPQ
jgi:hypothetical protein